jgi:hypothetical protein
MLSQTHTSTTLLAEYEVGPTETARSAKRAVEQPIFSVQRRLLQSLGETLIFKFNRAQYLLPRPADNNQLEHAGGHVILIFRWQHR